MMESTYSIRSGVKRSHAFNQSYSEETIDNVPLKFKNLSNDQIYMKKPKKNPQPVSQVQSIPQKPHIRLGYQCLPFLQPKLCQQCLNMLCEKCRTGKFLKKNICQQCYYKLCSQCIAQVWKKKDKKQKISLRRYAIPLKNPKNLHFANCQCGQCINDHAPSERSHGRSRSNPKSECERYQQEDKIFDQ